MNNYKFTNDGVTNTGSANIEISTDQAAIVSQIFKTATNDANSLLKLILIITPESGRFVTK
jgi:hypothetical protein